MTKSFLIKYGEIGVKGKNRHRFEEALRTDIDRRLKKCEGTFRVTREHGRLYVEGLTDFDFNEVVDALKKCFGITHICPMVSVEDKEIHRVLAVLTQHMKEELGDRSFTFKVFAKRSDKEYPMTSPEICREAGEYILTEMPNAKVDVVSPEIKVYVEIRKKAYAYITSIRGLGGMPLGTSGKAMLLLSGGIDSPVAGYMMAKRGIRLEAVYFHAPPYTSDRAKQKVVDLAKIVSEYAGPIRLHIVNFTDIQLAIYEKCPHDELTIIMRRYMMEIAERIGEEEDCQALITGESVGQVASQTIYSLVTTNEVCKMPVFRPLIAFDKQEIIELSQKINAYETSILPFEDCCTIFVATHPVTKPRLEQIKKSEQNLVGTVEEMVEAAIREKEVVDISS